jgi:thiamine monophosphate kinase
MAAIALDDDARMKVRQLVIDTFERIVIYNAGIIPGDTRTSPIDMVLVAKGGQSKMLRIHRRSGDLIDGEETT